ncbi:protein kinase domain-containing protein [Sorangium sp. So ce1128]
MATELTPTDALLGTQAYMAPEQWAAEPVDGRADLWAVGVMLYQMVTGEHPFAPLSPEARHSETVRESGAGPPQNWPMVA